MGLSVLDAAERVGPPTAASRRNCGLYPFALGGDMPTPLLRYRTPSRMNGSTAVDVGQLVPQNFCSMRKVPAYLTGHRASISFMTSSAHLIASAIALPSQRVVAAGIPSVDSCCDDHPATSCVRKLVQNERSLYPAFDSSDKGWLVTQKRNRIS